METFVKMLVAAMTVLAITFGVAFGQTDSASKQEEDDHGSMVAEIESANRGLVQTELTVDEMQALNEALKEYTETKEGDLFSVLVTRVIDKTDMQEELLILNEEGRAMFISAAGCYHRFAKADTWDDSVFISTNVWCQDGNYDDQELDTRTLSWQKYRFNLLYDRTVAEPVYCFTPTGTPNPRVPSAAHGKLCYRSLP